MISQILSVSNPLIKLCRSLKQKKGREEARQFIVEGILHVGEVDEAGWDIDALIYCPELLRSDFGQQLTKKIEQKGTKCVSVPRDVFESFVEKENPQGIAAVVKQKRTALSSITDWRLMVAVVSPQDPGNVGTILRTIDAVGVDGLILIDGGVEPYHPTTVRASMGTIFWKPFYEASFTEFVEWAHGCGARIIGTSSRATLDYRNIQADTRPVVLLLGSEQKGLLPEQMEVCDELVSLPMRGRSSSLNLSVAAGVFLYALSDFRK
jgi:TrmH family RNA methyltransferase